MENVVLGLYGSTLDRGDGRKRWQRWRPTIDVCRHGELPVSRFQLLYNQGHKRDVGCLVRPLSKWRRRSLGVGRGRGASFMRVAPSVSLGALGLVHARGQG